MTAQDDGTVIDPVLRRGLSFDANMEGEDDNDIVEGSRFGRFVVFRDVEGHLQAVAAGAIAAVTSTDDGALLLISGGRMVHVSHTMRLVLRWLDGWPGR